VFHVRVPTAPLDGAAGIAAIADDSPAVRRRQASGLFRLFPRRIGAEPEPSILRCEAVHGLSLQSNATLHVTITPAYPTASTGGCGATCANVS